MRIAFVAPSIALTADLDSTPFAADDLIEMARVHDVLVFVDENTAGSELLSASGMSVSISPKRPLEVDGSLKVSDALVAKGIAASHATMPLDEIWYTPDFLSDVSWFEPSLIDVPQLMIVDSAPVRLNGSIWSNADLIATHGIRSWAAMGRMSAVDGLITDVPLATYGLRADALPPVRPTGLDVHEEVSLPSDPRLVVLATRSIGARDLSIAIRETTDIAPMSEATTLVILHDDVAIGGSPSGRTIWEAVPEPLRRSTIVVAIRADGVAASFLSRADLIVCMTPAELAIPAIRSATWKVPFRVLRPTAPPDTLAPPDDAGSQAPTVVLVAIDETGTISEAVASDSPGSTVVLHRPDQQEIAQRIGAYDRLDAVDLTLVCEPDGIYGSVSLKVSDGILVLGGPKSASILRSLKDKTLANAVRSVINPANVDRVSLQILPVPGVDGFDAEWSNDAPGVLPIGRSALAVGPIVVMGYPAEVDGSIVHPEPREWVEGLAWQDRLRLLLPWKWGLLARAMRGRW